MNTENLDKMINFFKSLNKANFSLEELARGVIGNLQKIAQNPEVHICGTAGCLAGYLPAIFPEMFKWEAHCGATPITKPQQFNVFLKKSNTYFFPGQLVAIALEISNGFATTLAYELYYPKTEDRNKDGSVKLEAVIKRLEQLKSGEVNESNYEEKWAKSEEHELFD